MAAKGLQTPLVAASQATWPVSRTTQPILKNFGRSLGPVENPLVAVTGPQRPQMAAKGLQTPLGSSLSAHLGCFAYNSADLEKFRAPPGPC